MSWAGPLDCWDEIEGVERVFLRLFGDTRV